MKTVIYFMVGLLLIGVAVAQVSVLGGTEFIPTLSNVTYIAVPSGFSCTYLTVGNWCLNITGGTANGSYCNVSATPINITVGVGINTSSIGLNIYDELTGLPLNGTNVSIEIITKTVDVGTYLTDTGQLNLINITPGNYKIVYTAYGYVVRTYPLLVVGNQVYNLDLYLLNSSYATTVLANLYSDTGERLNGFHIKTLRTINGVYKLVEISETNYNGQADIQGELNTPLYYWIITDGVDDYLQTTETEIYSSTLDFWIVIRDSVGQIMDNERGLKYTLSYDNATNLFTYTYDDSNNLIDSTRLIIYDSPDNTIVTQTSSTSKSGTLTINMTPYQENGSTFTGKVYVTYGNETDFLTAQTHTYTDSPNLRFKAMGVFGTIIIMTLLAFIAYWNPAIMLIMEAVAVLLTRIVGLHELSYTATITAALVFAIVAYIVSDRT